MGISSDGVLYFGFLVGEDESKPDWLIDAEGEEMDFDDWLLLKAGLPAESPWEVRQKLEKACPAELEMYCSYDYPMYVLAMRGKEVRANRGDAIDVTDRMSVTDAEIATFKAWCETNAIPYQEPKWLLCSMYG